MGVLMRLVFVIHVPGRAASKSAGDGMMVRVMAGNAAHHSAAQATLGGSGIGGKERSRERDNKRQS